jgi:hypothetical protein
MSIRRGELAGPQPVSPCGSQGIPEAMCPCVGEKQGESVIVVKLVETFASELAPAYGQRTISL